MKWIWPLSWYFRIRQLEAELELERRVAREAQRQLAEAKFWHSAEMIAMSNAYSASVSSMLSTLQCH